MNKYSTIWLNGSYLPGSDFKVNFTNRAFRYGDGLFETMHANGLVVQFLSDHFNRIIKGAGVLKMILPSYFTIDYLSEQIQGLLTRLKLFQGAKVRILIVRKEGGLYLPQNNDVDIFIEASYLSKGPYELNEIGLSIDIYHPENGFIQQAPLNGFKSMNALPYILAGIYAVEHGLNDVIIANIKGCLVEATSSNIFLIKGSEIFTPSLNSGCLDGVMRRQIINVIKDSEFSLIESDQLNHNDLNEMDELFLTNAVSAIHWVGGFRGRRYLKRQSKKILQAINLLAGF